MTANNEPATDKIQSSARSLLASGVLVANAFVWYFYSGRFLSDVTSFGGLEANEIMVIRCINVLGTIAAALLGVFVVYRFGKRVRFLRIWMIAGVFLSLIPLAIDISGLVASTMFFAITGIYFGLGMPVSLAYFAASTRTENRGRTGGIIFFSSLLMVFLLGMLIPSGIALNAFILALCPVVGLALTLIIKPAEQEITVKNQESYGTILRSKPFLLYLVPWLMFSIINFLILPMVSTINSEFFQLSSLIENVLGGVLAVVFGFLGDRIGRKRLVVAGFTLLGLGYASLGLSVGGTDAVVNLGWWFYTAVDGVAWGALYAIFLMTIWGDLAQGKSSEKYYALGFAPFIGSVFLEAIGTTLQPMLFPSAVFSFASVFLFLSVLPLAYAPETLNLKEKEFKSYIEKALRTKTRQSEIN
ncbi:MAG: hypothetical protein NWF05_03140 [Candidatus Bathyarchaeota archaeon]|nr:hypothetical protein [Candidatus Bathyarchaeota archaeon]